MEWNGDGTRQTEMETLRREGVKGHFFRKTCGEYTGVEVGAKVRNGGC